MTIKHIYRNISYSFQN